LADVLSFQAPVMLSEAKNLLFRNNLQADASLRSA